MVIVGIMIQVRLTEFWSKECGWKRFTTLPVLPQPAMWFSTLSSLLCHSDAKDLVENSEVLEDGRATDGNILGL